LQKYIVYRKRKIFFGTSGKFDDAQLLQALTKHNKEVMLLPVSDVHKDNGELANLEKAGISYTKAVMYRTVSNDFQPDEKLDYDMLIFFSPVGIASLLKNFPNFDQEKENIKVACYGPATCKAAEEAGLKLDISAPSPKFPSMTGALENYLKEHA
jgi:uroporphyrinogen-III synthase